MASYLGPTLLLNKGDEIIINVTNQIGDTTTTHWHGFHLPAIMDGGPHQLILPGDTWSPTFTVMNLPATYWYHPHLHGKTGEQVYHGLAGLIIIQDEESQQLDLPGQYGVDDFPVIVQDRRFNEDGSLAYLTEIQDAGVGMKGDQVLVNGVITPTLNAPAQMVRLRILNASNARNYNFGFSDDREFYQVATDGGLLEEPVSLTRLLLGIGERAEIIVDLGSDQNNTLTLMSFSSELPSEIIGDIPDSLDIDNFDVMTINVGRPSDNPVTTLPDSLVRIKYLKEDNAVNRDNPRRFEISIIPDPNGERGDLIGLINGVPMDINRIDQTIMLGDTEIWEVTNNTTVQGTQPPLAHPFHVHDIQFQVLNRDGSEPPANERGWKDTVLIKRGETVQLIAKFEDFADPELPYMFHCHILEHEDRGMMGQFVVVDQTTSVANSPEID